MIEGEVPILMDPMPATNIIALDEDKNNEAKVLEAAKGHVYREQCIFQKDVQAVRDMLKSGNGWQYIDFDPDGENGEGSVTVTNLEWSQVIIDPSAKTLDQARYAIIDVPLSNEELRKKYPKTAEEAISQPLKDLYTFSNPKYARENQNIGGNKGTTDVGRYESKDMTYVEECWLKDYSLTKIPDDETQIQLTEESAQLMQGINPDITKWEDHQKHHDAHHEQKIMIAAQALGVNPAELTDADFERLEADPQVGLIFKIIDDHIEMHEMYIHDMNEEEVGKKPKYPHGLRLIVKTGKVLHSDGSPGVDDGLIPLAPFYNYKGERIYADGSIKNMLPQQKTLNELDAKEFKGLKLVTNPGWLVDKESEVDADTLTDEDGIVVTKNQGTEVQRLPAGQVSPQLSVRAQREYEAMQRIEGVGEAVLGEAPKTITSGIQLRRIQMQAIGRIRLKSKMIEAAIERRDRLIVSRIMKYWSTERVLRAENAHGEIKFIKFDPREMRDFDYDLVLSPGTMVGTDNESIYETYKELLLAKQIDLKMFLSVVNMPKKQALIDMLNQNDQTAAQMQQLQQQNLELKMQFAPQTLTPEEVQLIKSSQQGQPQMAPQ